MHSLWTPAGVMNIARQPGTLPSSSTIDMFHLNNLHILRQCHNVIVGGGGGGKQTRGPTHPPQKTTTKTPKRWNDKCSFKSLRQLAQESNVSSFTFTLSIHKKFDT
jgi:hypothetical protein